jgi:Ni,Fe-hydrogenase III large subunit
MTGALVLANGGAAALDQLPRLGFGALTAWITGAVAQGRRVSALFAHPAGDRLELVAVLANDTDGVLELAAAGLEPGQESFASMTPACPEVHLFEREIAEQWGVRPLGHPWLKPVRFQPPRRAGAPSPPTVGVTDFYRIEGDEVHEVAVGPVHAGVIEPGHFRFQCHGENVMHLEISLGYQHRGVERAILTPGPRAIHYAETLAGDTTIGHATAFCAAVEALSGTRVPPRALALRAIALELERLANHVGDLGALANDVGFLPTAAYCGRLRGDYLNLTAELCGSRFGRGMVRAGRVGFDVTDGQIEGLLGRLEPAARDTDTAARLLWETASVQARFEETGRVTIDTARTLGLVGVAARASGLGRDVRNTHPSGYYRFAHLPMSAWTSGDVFARAYVRGLEIRRSIDFIRTVLRTLPGGAIAKPPKPMRGAHIAAALVEGWRGEICHVAITDEDGRLAAYKIVDPSFHNWTGLAMALRDQQISDFPLCNKSFNLSYCGHDL